MPFQLCTWLLPLNACFACYHNRLQVCVCVRVCICLIVLHRCLFVIFFSKHAIQVQTVPGKRSKQGRCTYLRHERWSFPPGQMTAEHFCHLLMYSVVFSSKSSCIPPLTPSLPSMTLILSSIAPPCLSLLMSTKYKAPKSMTGSNYSFDWKFSCFRINVFFLLSNFRTVQDIQN